MMGLLAGWTSSHHDNGNFLIEIDGNQTTGEVYWTGYYRYEKRLGEGLASIA